MDRFEISFQVQWSWSHGLILAKTKTPNSDHGNPSNGGALFLHLKLNRRYQKVHTQHSKHKHMIKINPWCVYACNRNSKFFANRERVLVIPGELRVCESLETFRDLRKIEWNAWLCLNRCKTLTARLLLFHGFWVCVRVLGAAKSCPLPCVQVEFI